MPPWTPERRIYPLSKADCNIYTRSFARNLQQELSKNRSAALKEKIEKAKSEAQKRVHNVRAAERLREEQKIERLIFKQNTSIEAINVARLLSSHFEEKLDFKPQFKREMQGRLDKLLTSDRVGEFYL